MADQDEQARLRARISVLNRAINNARPRSNRQRDRWAPYPSRRHQRRDPMTSNASHVSTSAQGSHQLMTSDTFQREQQRRQQPTRVAGEAAVDGDEYRALSQLVMDSWNPNPSAPSDPPGLIIEGIRFWLYNNGTELVRKHDASTNHLPTPSTVNVSGVDLYATESGNLRRANGIRPQLQAPRPPQCERFSRNGICYFGAKCRFSHDPDQVGICKVFLHQGACPRGVACDLSHDANYHRVPACIHFLRGNCTNSTCLYPHIRVPESAPVCRSFSTLSYCPLGEECGKRHLFVCADFANTGHCGNFKCTLPHPQYAHELRKKYPKQTTADRSDLSSDQESATGDSANGEVDSNVGERDYIPLT